jgi:uncharacterized protein (TIGR00369 family)
MIESRACEADCERTDNPDRLFMQRVVNEQLHNVPCNGNPVLESLAAIVVTASKTSCQMHYWPKREYLQGNGTLHGGILSTMLDSTMAMTVLSGLPAGANAATINLNVAFLKPAHWGRILVEASIERSGRKASFLTARAFDQNDRCVASAMATFVMIGATGLEPSGGH